MTTNAHAPMNCDDFTERSMDYMEGDVDAATRAAMDAHLARCADCSALLADMRSIASAAAALPALAPSRDLWEGIAARIEAPVISLETRVADERRRAPAWLRPAVAAAALVVATSTITYYATKRSAGDSTIVAPATTVARGGPSTAPAPGAAAESASTSAPATEPAIESPSVGAPAVSAVAARSARTGARASGLTSADATYDLEIKRLRALIDRRRSQLDTGTVNVIERNLKIIDEAIAQCRAALARDPNSRFLLENLNSALDNKVQLLRTAAMLPART